MTTIMDRKVRIYIPDGYTTELDYVTKRLAKRFGGTIKYKTRSTRINNEGDLIKEGIIVIEAWYEEKEHIYVLTRMIDLALHVKEKCIRDHVAIEVEGKMYII